MIIPIGADCTSAVFKREINKISSSLPFDWMISTPEFVFLMLELLLEYNMNIEVLVREHFFRFDKSVDYTGYKNKYITASKYTQNQSIICNSKYNVLFPNDIYNEETIKKYINRFTRLKSLIITMDYKKEVKFVYTSFPSSESSTYIIDEIPIVKDVYKNLMKIDNLITKFRKNYKIIIFDAICTDDTNILERKNTLLVKLQPETHPNFLISQMEQYAYLFYNLQYLE
jgi:hypothetical protein